MSRRLHVALVLAVAACLLFAQSENATAAGAFKAPSLKKIGAPPGNDSAPKDPRLGAEAGTYVPDALAPEFGVGLGGDGVQAFSVGQYTARWRCSAPLWASVQNVPSGLVNGNCVANGAFDSRYIAGPITNHGPQEADYWVGGYVHTPSYQQCGWINLNLIATQYASNPQVCLSTASMSEDAFVYPGYKWTGPSGITGMPYNPYRVCPEYANAKPWTVGFNPSGTETGWSTYPINPPNTWNTDGTSPFLIRYASRYPGTDPRTGAATYWVMLQDTRVQRGRGNWAFVSGN